MASKLLFSNLSRKRFIMTVCATDSSTSSFELVPLPLQYLIWPRVRRLLRALRGISFLFSYLSSFRHTLSPALYLPLSDNPTPLQVFLTQQTHTGSQARQTARLKLGGKNGSLPCSEYESNSEVISICQKLHAGTARPLLIHSNL